MQIRTSLIAAAIALVSASSFAQAPATKPTLPATPRVDTREANQEARIQQGVNSGALTPHETAHLDREQGAIQRAEANAKADGSVTSKERKRLARLQHKASQDIHQQKHDAQTAVKR